MSAVQAEAPTDLWDECGERLWLRHDLAATRSKARYVAWTGRGLPAGFNEGCGRLIDLRVKVSYMRPAVGEEAIESWTDELWLLCDKDHPQAVRYWEISV